MSSLESYLQKRGISEQQMAEARAYTQTAIEAYRLREARKANKLTQTEVASKMGVSQNRVSRMESGELGTMSLDSIRRYIEALGGHMKLIAELPTGPISLI